MKITNKTEAWEALRSMPRETAISIVGHYTETAKDPESITACACIALIDGQSAYEFGRAWLRWEWTVGELLDVLENTPDGEWTPRDWEIAKQLWEAGQGEDGIIQSEEMAKIAPHYRPELHSVQSIGSAFYALTGKDWDLEKAMQRFL